MSVNGLHGEKPVIDCPIPFAIHGEAAALEEHAISWMRHHGYIANPAEEERARQAKFGTLAALTYPYGQREGVELVADWLVWFFLHDDWYVEGIVEADGDRQFGRPGPAPARRADADQQNLFARYALRTVRLLKDPDDLPPEPGPHLVAFRDLCVRLRGMATAEQVLRVTGAVTEYFLGGGCEVLFRTARAFPPLDDYPIQREFTSSMLIFFALIDVVAGFELPNALWCRPDIQSLTQSAARVVGYTNDILSGFKEFSWPGAVNLPLVLARHHGCPLPRALERAADCTWFELEVFVEEAGRLRRGGDSRVARYITGLESWIRGNLDWSLTSHRYPVDTPDLDRIRCRMFGE